MLAAVSAGLMLQSRCQLDDARFLLLPACLPAFGVASCSRLESERHGALLSSPLLSSESPCLDARLDDGDAGDLDFLGVCLRGAAGEIALEHVSDRRLGVMTHRMMPALRSSSS
jgi:hypothetical protein